MSSLPQSVDEWWTGSTNQLLDRDALPVGSMDAISWQKAESMIIYWAEQPKQLDKCFQLLDRMVEEAETQPEFQMHIYLVHAILLQWKRTVAKFQGNLLPSQLLSKLDDYQDRAPDCFEPNIATYTILLDGAASCSDPRERVQFTEALLNRLILESQDDHNADLRPTAVTFGTVIKAWSKSGNKEHAEKSEALLRRAIALRDEHGWAHLEITTILYTSVLTAYANAGQPEAAQRLLREMFQELVDGNHQVRPNIRSINAVLSAWSKSSSPNAFEAAKELFRNVEDLIQSGALQERPDVISYNCLLGALAKSSKREDAVEHAERLMNDMMETSVQPTLVTFTSLLRVLASSSHPDRVEKVETWLAKAKELGIQDHRFLLDQYESGLARQRKHSRPITPKQDPNE